MPVSPLPLAFPGDAIPPDAAAPRASAAPRFIGSNIYRGSSYGGAHPLRIPRVPTVIDLARALGWLPAERYLTSPRAKPVALKAWHSDAYVDALQAAEREGTVSDAVRARHNLGTLSNPVYPEVFRRPATAAGASIMAARLLRDGGVIHSPGGGTHHGLPDRANGFCYLNDCVLAILALRREGLTRIAYVDIDAHHCDGVAHAFAGDPAITLVSVHEERRWPFTGALDERGAGAMWNLPMPRGCNDTEMRAALERVILPILQAARPQAIVLQCGADALLEDPLSRLACSNNAHFGVVRAVMGLAPRLLVLGGGGYNPWSVGRCWTGIWGVLNGREMPDRLPAAARDVLAALRFPGARRGAVPEPYLLTTLRDAPREGPVRPEVEDRLRALEARRGAWV